MPDDQENDQKRTYLDLARSLIELVTTHAIFSDCKETESMVGEWKKIEEDGWYDVPEQLRAGPRFDRVTSVLQKNEQIFTQGQIEELMRVVKG